MEKMFDITEHLGVLSDGKAVTELNKVEWNGRKAQYDLRRWGLENGAKVPYKGLTLNVDELKALKEILNKMEVL